MPKDGAPTRDRILDAAERLVIENGFAATSVDQVIAESGTSKGSFFHHFESKLDLARSLVARYAAADVANLDAALATVRERTGDPAKQAIEFVRIFEDGADELMSAQSSCLYVSILTERQLAAAGTSEQIVGAIEAWRVALSEILRAALADRPAAADVDPDALADHVFVTFEGAFLLCRSTGDTGHMRAQLRVLRRMFESLLA
ncbi:MAG TPA: helix-turn-helix domain-containing protein [Actinophytocola sp.]|uniref:TetR/AcrR family transcriptional regulator n=1 Tax=Actinophytocola sp. TaxID=1872138 RepID=UPI002F93AC8D